MWRERDWAKGVVVRRGGSTASGGYQRGGERELGREDAAAKSIGTKSSGQMDDGLGVHHQLRNGRQLGCRHRCWLRFFGLDDRGPAEICDWPLCVE